MTPIGDLEQQQQHENTHSVLFLYYHRQNFRFLSVSFTFHSCSTPHTPHALVENIPKLEIDKFRVTLCQVHV